MFVATQLCVHYLDKANSYAIIIKTIGTLEKHSLLVLSYQKVCPLLLIVPPEDRDHTDSRRIKPNSRTLLIGEQPNPSKLLPPEDRMSRHRINFLNLSVNFRLYLYPVYEYIYKASGYWRVVVEGLKLFFFRRCKIMLIYINNFPADCLIFKFFTSPSIFPVAWGYQKFSSLFKVRNINRYLKL